MGASIVKTCQKTVSSKVTCQYLAFKNWRHLKTHINEMIKERYYDSLKRSSFNACRM